jgi:hypothetical protein
MRLMAINHFEKKKKKKKSNDRNFIWILINIRNKNSKNKKPKEFFNFDGLTHELIIYLPIN